jgi:hypothetical protein
MLMPCEASLHHDACLHCLTLLFDVFDGQILFVAGFRANAHDLMLAGDVVSD